MPRRSRADMSGCIIYDHAVCGETFYAKFIMPDVKQYFILIARSICTDRATFIQIKIFTINSIARLYRDLFNNINN